MDTTESYRNVSSSPIPDKSLSEFEIDVSFTKIFFIILDQKPISSFTLDHQGHSHQSQERGRAPHPPTLTISIFLLDVPARVIKEEAEVRDHDW